MANATGKAIDKTFLSLSQAERRMFLHRDYIAHCFRWSHVAHQLYKGSVYKEARILDVGCGRETPLLNLLYTGKLMPAYYFGVDYGPIDFDLEACSKSDRIDLYEKEDACSCNDLLDEKTDGTFTHAVSFEVLEHVEPIHAASIVEVMFNKLMKGGVAYISTPNWNEQDCAANHVNEMKYDVLGRMFENVGFEVVNAFGTFASMSDYKDTLTECQRSVYEKLHAYYDTNVLSTIMAPLVDASRARNALWVLRKPKNKWVAKFKELKEIKKPWSSSAKQDDFLKLGM